MNVLPVTDKLEIVKASELQVGDTVQAFEGAFGTAVVRQVNDDTVELYRPYAITSDFKYGSPEQVICYTGVENFTVFRSDRKFGLLRRQALR